jgi:hypothetical protein
MTLKKAIKSGKPFKRPTHIQWFIVGERGILGKYIWQVDYIDEREHLHPFVDDILATDWEVKP